MSYLDNGGNLYIESVDIGKDYETTAFFEYMGIEYKGDGGYEEVYSLEGECVDCEETLKFYYLGEYSAHYSIDQLKAIGSGEMLLSSEEGNSRMLINESDNYKIISSSVVLAAMANGESFNLKPFMISEFVNYFLGYNPVTSLQENIKAITSGNNFPNPFSNKTTITYSLNEPGQVNIAIYNLNGQLVKQLENSNKNSGTYQLNWNATDKNGEIQPNGYYFCKITSGDFTLTKKMILLR